MDEILARIWNDVGARVTGPMSLRLLLQPTVATILAIKAGLADARIGRPAYFWTILTDPVSRRELLLDGWKSVAKVFCLAVILDAVYQFIVQRWIYLGETLLVAFVLACVPYLLIRGPVNRLARRGRTPVAAPRP